MTDSEDSMDEPDRKFKKLLEKTLSDHCVKKVDREEEEKKLSKMLSKEVKKGKVVRKAWNRSPIFKAIHKRIQESEGIKNRVLPPDFLKPSISKIKSFQPHFIKRKEKRENPQDRSVWIYKSESRGQCLIADKLGGREKYGSRKTFSKEHDKPFWHPSWNISTETICGPDLQKSTSDLNSFISTRKRKVPIPKVGEKKSHKKVANQDFLEAFRKKLDVIPSPTKMDVTPPTNMDVAPPVESCLLYQESYSPSKETTNPEINSSAGMSSTQNKSGQNRKSEITEYSKSKSTDSISEINSSDEFLSLVDETNFVAQRRKFHPLKNAYLDVTPSPTKMDVTPSRTKMDVTPPTNLDVIPSNETTNPEINSSAEMSSTQSKSGQNLKSEITEYSKSRSTDSISEINTSDEFLISLVDETNFVTQRGKFHPLKKSNLDVTPSPTKMDVTPSRTKMDVTPPTNLDVIPSNETTNPEINSSAEMSSTQNKSGQNRKSEITEYSKSKSTDSISEINMSDKFLSLVDETNFVAQRGKFHPLKNANLDVTPSPTKMDVTPSRTKMNVTPPTNLDVIPSKEITNPEINSSAEMSSAQSKPGPRILSNKPARRSLTKEILTSIRNQRALNHLESFKDDNEQNRESQKTEYSKSNSTDSISEINTSDEYLSLANEANFVTQRRKFHPLKNSTLISPKEVASENFSSRKRIFSCGLEPIDESKQKSKKSSQMGDENVDKMNFVSDRRNFDPSKNDSSFEGNKTMMDVTNFENFKAGSPILSRGKKMRQRKQNQFLGEDKFVNTSSRIGKSSKIGNMSLEENAERNKKGEISEDLIAELDTTLKKFSGMFDRNILKKALESYIQNEFDPS